MRPLSTAQTRLLASAAGYSAYGRVRVLGPDGNWYNLSSLFGRDFLEGVDVDESLDAPVAQATVRVLRQVHGLSLAPLMVDSRANNLAGAYSPLLDANRAMRVECALLPLGQSPTADTVWLPLFYGRIDEVDAGAEVLTLKGRDYAGVLQDVWLESEHPYGSASGTPLQSVCQQLLNDAHLSAFGLYTPVNPAWALGPYKQDVEPCMDAVGKLAQARGWELRWKVRPDTGDWALWLWSPDRAATGPAWTYGPRDYKELGQLSTAIADVRTVVEVVYSDAGDLDAAGQPKRKTVRRENAAATARYGYLAADGTLVPRFCRVAEGASSNIRTLEEAARLAEAGLADLSTASLGSSVEVPVHPALELGDLVRLSANGVHFTADQVLAVRQVTHSLTSTSAKTRLALLGKPSLSPRAWLSMEARPGVAPSAPFTGPAAPSGLAVTNAASGAVLLFTAPPSTTGPEADTYELHVGTAAGFVLSSASLKAVSATTRFDVTGLLAGGTYYARVRSRDKRGNVGPASPEVTLAPLYTPPGSLLPLVTYGSLPLNGDFEAQSRAGAPPDGCLMLAGAWGVDAFLESTGAYSGSRALRLAVSASVPTPQLALAPFVVRPGERLGLKALAYAALSGSTASVQIRWLNSSLSLLSTSLSGSGSLTAATWTTLQRLLTVPTDARYAQVVVSAAGALGRSVYIDSVNVEPTLTVVAEWQTLAHPSLGGNLTAYSNNWNPDVNRPVAWRINPIGEVELRGSVNGGMPGLVAFNLTAAAPSGSANIVPARWRVPAGDSGEATVSVFASGTTAQVVVTGLTLMQVALDSIRYSVA